MHVLYVRTNDLLIYGGKFSFLYFLWCCYFIMFYGFRCRACRSGDAAMHEFYGLIGVSIGMILLLVYSIIARRIALPATSTPDSMRSSSPSSSPVTSFKHCLVASTATPCNIPSRLRLAPVLYIFLSLQILIESSRLAMRYVGDDVASVERNGSWSSFLEVLHSASVISFNILAFRPGCYLRSMQYLEVFRVSCYCLFVLLLILLACAWLHAHVVYAPRRHNIVEELETQAAIGLEQRKQSHLRAIAAMNAAVEANELASQEAADALAAAEAEADAVTTQQAYELQTEAEAEVVQGEDQDFGSAQEYEVEEDEAGEGNDATPTPCSDEGDDDTLDGVLPGSVVPLSPPPPPPLPPLPPIPPVVHSMSAHDVDLEAHVLVDPDSVASVGEIGVEIQRGPCACAGGNGVLLSICRAVHLAHALRVVRHACFVTTLRFRSYCKFHCRISGSADCSSALRVQLYICL
jgi:hypothetical protein